MTDAVADAHGPELIVLGIAQDAGYPQAGCRRACCSRAWDDPGLAKHVACVAVVDPGRGRRWLIDATPDLSAQLHRLDGACPALAGAGLSGVFLTHGHMGHYTGLLQLGREAMAARHVPVFAMPRMAGFMRANQPWKQLVDWGHVDLQTLRPGHAVPLVGQLSVTPSLVPHRDECTETVAFRIRGPRRSCLYVPDIDAWSEWDRSLEDVVADVDAAFLDGTFYSRDELVGRDLTEIPHPPVVDTMALLAHLPASHKAKVRFTHLNHTNPLLRPDGCEYGDVIRSGFAVARELERLEL